MCFLNCATLSARITLDQHNLPISLSLNLHKRDNMLSTCPLGKEIIGQAYSTETPLLYFKKQLKLFKGFSFYFAMYRELNKFTE